MEPLPEGESGAAPEPGLGQRLEALEKTVRRLADASSSRQLLDAHVPAGERVVVLADPASLPSETLGRPVSSIVPDTAGSASAIAQLEARRITGVRFVFVPEGAREAVDQDGHLAEHLRSFFRAVGSDADAGTIFEVSSPAADDEDRPALGALIDSLGMEERLTPILDWTHRGMENALPGRPLFEPVAPKAVLLPYLDSTIDVVLVDDPERMDEAARVAAAAAVRVTTDEDGSAVPAEVRRMRPARNAAPAPVRIIVPTGRDDEWLGALTDAVAGRPGIEIRPAVEPITAAGTGAPAVVLVERGVVPLPGCIEAAERLLDADQRVGGVAVKLFDADGSLEAAGGAAFADGSLEGIAKGADVSASWHEFVRPVAVAVGLIVLRPAAVRHADPDHTGEFDLAGLSARLWSNGWELHYQPHAPAVRVLSQPGARSVWIQPPDGLPARPQELDEVAWRRLLTNGLVGAVR
jgi:hypothetical protein